MIFYLFKSYKETKCARSIYYTLLWSCANKRNTSLGTNSGRMAVHIASAKIPKYEESISPPSFYGQLPDYQSHVFSLIYPVDEFFLKEMRAWRQYNILFYCFCVWCESRESGGRGSSKFPFVTPVVETSSIIIIIIIIIYLFKFDLIYNNFVYNKYNKKQPEAN